MPRASTPDRNAHLDYFPVSERGRSPCPARGAGTETGVTTPPYLSNASRTTAETVVPSRAALAFAASHTAP